jgi:hypothetical protein
VLAAVGGLLALGVRNDVLSAPPEAEPEDPGPGQCLHCGVEGPPTHVKPARASHDV